MNRSYWDETLLPEKFDVAVIGSGIIGLSTAIHLKTNRPDCNIGVLERGLIPVGASTKNAGFACFGSLSEIEEDIESMGEEAVVELIRERWTGLNYLQELTHGYDIGFQNNGGYELFTDNELPLYDRCREKMDRINQLLKENFGQEVFKEANDRISEFQFTGVRHLVTNPFESQLHSGLLMRALMDKCRKMNIHLLYGAEVTGWEESNREVLIHLGNWNSLKSEKLVISTNGFAKELLPNLEVKPTRAQVLITDPIPGLNVKGTFHVDRGYYYFRNIDNRILLGGARQMDIENEFTASQQTTEKIQLELERMLRDIILPGKEVTIEKRWTGTMGTGPSKTPIVKRTTDRVAVAVRMAGMGIAIGSRIGQKAADLIID